MAIYDKSTKELMIEWARSNLLNDRVFEKREVIDWFAKNYPKIRPNTVSLHIEGLSTNNARHRGHHSHIRPETNWDLFYKVGPNQFRLWNPESDPPPQYELPNDLQSLTTSGFSDEENPSVDHTIEHRNLDEIREFAYERDLQNFLSKNIELIEPGLRVFEDEGFVGIEYPAGGRRIDILAVDANDQFVVIELKASRAYDRVVGQTARYMAWVEKNMSTEKPVRGMIIASQVTEDLKLAASILDSISLLEYSLKFEIRQV